MTKKPAQQKNKEFTKFRECDNCGLGIGKITYHSGDLDGEYCSSECYVEAMMESRGWPRDLEPEAPLNKGDLYVSAGRVVSHR